MLSAWRSRDQKIYSGYRTAESRSEVSNTDLSAAQPFEVGEARKCFLPLPFQPFYLKIYFY
jgi:ABC-type protease/lipase transport system fused ATPase/permease subunit